MQDVPESGHASVVKGSAKALQEQRDLGGERKCLPGSRSLEELDSLAVLRPSQPADRLAVRSRDLEIKHRWWMCHRAGSLERDAPFRDQPHRRPREWS